MPTSLVFRSAYTPLTALIWYDYTLKLKQESEVFWFSQSPRSRITTCLYVTLHYPLLGNTLYLFAVTHKLPVGKVMFFFVLNLSMHV